MPELLPDVGLTCRLNDLIRVLAELGIVYEAPSRGSHGKLRKAGLRPYTIPASNGTRTEVPKVYLLGLCRAFELDFDDLERLLRE